MKWLLLFFFSLFVCSNALSVTYGFKRAIDFSNPEEVYYYQFWKDKPSTSVSFLGIEGMYKFRHKIVQDDLGNTYELYSCYLPVMRKEEEFPQIKVFPNQPNDGMYHLNFKTELEGEGTPYWMEIEVANYYSSENELLKEIKLNDILFKLDYAVSIRKLEGFQSTYEEYIDSWEEERLQKKALPMRIQLAYANVFECETYYELSFIYFSKYLLKETDEKIIWYKRSFSLSPFFTVSDEQKLHYYFIQMKVSKNKIPDLQVIYLADRIISL